MNRFPSILVVDSGVGGLSVCEAILARIPSGLSITYIADDAAFPYGLKSDDFLLSRLSELIRVSLQREPYDLVVLACNTISTLLLPALRQAFSVPFVGVVPAIKPAALQTKNDVVGLLATPGTITRPYIDQLMMEFAPNVALVRVGSRVLVEQAEQLLLHGSVDTQKIAYELASFLPQGDNSPDTLVLGCTHFPFLKESISEILPNVVLVDSGEAIARRVKDLLVLPNLDAPVDAQHKIFFTGEIKDSPLFRSTLEKMGFRLVEVGLLSSGWLALEGVRRKDLG
jgi:glutamate racemase